MNRVTFCNFVILELMIRNGKVGPYFASIPIQDRYKESCQNKALVAKGAFTMRKSKPQGTSEQWTFESILTRDENEILSTLWAKEGGVCNDVRTEKGSWSCGLATALLGICFTDPDIGTFIPSKSVDSDFGRPIEKKYQEAMEKNCERISYLECAPFNSATYASCSGYLTAALNALNSMMFTFHEIKNWNVLSIANAKVRMKSDPTQFIADFGPEWFFCKCKADRDKECESMTR